MEFTPSDSTSQTAKGFTLIEILVALVILSFVALGIAGLFSHAIKSNASGHDYALLAAEARFALESLQALPFFDDPANADGPLDSSTSPRTLTSVNPDFTITYTVDNFRIDNWANVSAGNWTTATDDNANIKRITMTVASTKAYLDGRRVFTVTSLKIPG